MGDSGTQLKSLVGDVGELLDRLNREAWCPQRPEEHARWEREALERAERAEREAAESRAAAVRSLAKRTTPALARAVLEGSPEMTPAVESALKWAKSGVRGLLIRGGVGAGKSFAAAMVVNASHFSATWHRPNDFVSAVLHSYDENAPRLGRSLVVVDDIGRETKADFEEALCAFLDDEETRFVLTTNLTKDQFRERYGLRLIDRLNHCAEALTVKGVSRRRQTGGF